MSSLFLFFKTLNFKRLSTLVNPRQVKCKERQSGAITSIMVVVNVFTRTLKEVQYTYHSISKILQNFQSSRGGRAQCQIGPLFFPLPYFHSFRDGVECQKIQKNILQINLISFCATIKLKLSKLQKIAARLACN